MYWSYRVWASCPAQPTPVAFSAGTPHDSNVDGLRNRSIVCAATEERTSPMGTPLKYGLLFFRWNAVK